MPTAILRPQGTANTSALDFGYFCRQAEVNDIRSIELDVATYTVSSGTYTNLTGPLEVRGKGAGTRIVFRGNAPGKIPSPDVVAGFPATRDIITSCIGVYFSDNKGAPSGVTFRDLTIAGFVGSMTTAGDYSLMNFSCHDVTFINVRFENETSDTFDATAGTLSPYKALQKRNVTTLALVSLGEDLWVEPNSAIARGVSKARFTGCTWNGEPLNETAGVTLANASLIAVRTHKCASVIFENDMTGDFYHPAAKIVSDVILSANPAEGVTISVPDWDPWLRRTVPTPYTFTAMATIPTDTAFAKFVPIVGTKEATIDRLVTKIRNNKKGTSTISTAYHEALSDADYLPGVTAQGTVAACRVQTAAFSSSDPLVPNPLTLISFSSVGSWLAQTAMTKVTVNSAPADNTTVVLTSPINAGSSITAKNIKFLAGGGTDDATNFFVNTTGSNGAIALRIANEINANVDKLGFVATAVAADVFISCVTTGTSSVAKGTAGADPGAAITVAVQAADTNTVIRSISTGQSRELYWRWGKKLEDSVYKEINGAVVGPDSYRFSWVDDCATGHHNSFGPNLWSEAGHFIINNVIAHSVRYGTDGSSPSNSTDGFIQSRGACFGSFGPALELGQMGKGPPSSKNPIVKVTAGTNVSRTVTLTNGNGADTDTIRIQDGLGGDVTFEEDTNGVVTGGNVAFTRGADSLTTMRNLMAQIRLKREAGLLKVFDSTAPTFSSAGAATMTLDLFTFDKPGTLTITPGGSGNWGGVSVSQPYLPVGFKLGGAVHYASCAGVAPDNASAIPLIWAEQCYEQVKISGFKAGLIPPPIKSDLSYACGDFSVGGSNVITMPAVNTTLTITPTDGSGAHTFVATAATETDAGTVHNISMAAHATPQPFAREVAERINEQMAGHVIATYYCSGGQETATAVDVALTITDCTVGANASFLAITSDTNNSFSLNGTFGNGTLPSCGAATTATGGEHMPIVMKDINSGVIENCSINGMHVGSYVGTTFFEVFSQNPINTNPETVFLGRPMKLVYVMKSASTLNSKVSLRDVTLCGNTNATGGLVPSMPWGNGADGSGKFVELGTNMVMGDISFESCSANGIEGWATSTATLQQNPAFSTAALVGTKTLTSTSTFAVYMGKAPRSVDRVVIRNRVTTAFGNDGATPWSEVAIAKGAPVVGGNPTLTVLGFTNTAATFNSNGQKSTTVFTVNPIRKGDDLWALFGNKATTATAVRAQDVADDIQAGYQAVATQQPSLILGTPTAFTLEGAAVLAPWVTISV